jgi:formate dehydrogenase major subunit
VADASQKTMEIEGSRVTTTICPYCAVGCGMLVMSEERKDDQYGKRRVVVHVEGDPDHPINENPFSGQMLNPASKKWIGPADTSSGCGSRQFPYVCTTCRVTEHWQTGVMTRHAPWLLELQPQLFVEMSWELANERVFQAGDLVEVLSKRGAVTAVAMPTARLKPFTVRGKTVHHVALPWCFGWKMPEDGSGGDSANLLTPNIGDANTMIPETKAFLVNLRRLDVTDRRQRSPRRV